MSNKLKYAIAAIVAVVVVGVGVFTYQNSSQSNNSATSSSSSVSSSSQSQSSAMAVSQQDLMGHWVSKSCETRPGNVYIKRDFKIYENTWEGDFMFYADSACKTLASIGYSTGPARLGENSKTVAGAREAEFVLQEMKLTPKNKGTVDYLNTAKAGSCGKEKWKLDTTQDLQLTKGCSVLGLDLQSCNTEYEIVRVSNNELSFGARPADGSNLCTAAKRPTSLQVPLVKQDVKKNIIGKWMSKGCETRPGNLYLKRDFRVKESSWDGDFIFYNNSKCEVETGRGYAEGPYTIGDKASGKLVANAAEFTLAKFKYTPKNDATTAYLNTAKSGTCGKLKWQKNVQQDTTDTNGCSVLGLNLQSCGTEFEIVKVTNDELFFGARPADGSNLCTADKRPTSFQVPLMRS